MRCTGHNLLHDVLDLGQFVHQVDLVVQTSGGINEHHIRAVGFGRLERIKCHGSRVRTLLLFDNRYAYPFAPYTQLLNSRSTEGIGSTEIHFLAGLLVHVREFADGSSLAYTVDANYHDYVG